MAWRTRFGEAEVHLQLQVVSFLFALGEHGVVWLGRAKTGNKQHRQAAPKRCGEYNFHDCRDVWYNMLLREYNKPLRSRVGQPGPGTRLTVQQQPLTNNRIS